MNNTVHYRHVRHTLALMCAKNHLLIFSSFLDIWENVEWPRFFGPPCTYHDCDLSAHGISAPLNRHLSVYWHCNMCLKVNALTQYVMLRYALVCCPCFILSEHVTYSQSG